MSDIAIRVQNISKRYVIGNTSSGSLRETIAGLFGGSSSDTEEFYALRDVSFEVKRGEAIGIIGKNGAGKSTLLKVLSRITEPTTGRIEIDGRVSSLLEVGTGFHPELTGRENVFLNGTILGMKRQEIKDKFDEIVDFSGVEKFLDTPVKRYSSGMKVRLAFAVAAHLEPEILIIDEVLAVGDAEFQKKCLGKMEDVAGEGRTIIFVSHDMGAVKRLTHRCIFLQFGQVSMLSMTEEVVEEYLSTGYQQSEQNNNLDYFRRTNLVDKVVEIKNLQIDEGKVVPLSSPFTMQIEIEVYREISGSNLTIIVKKSDGTRVAVLFSWDNDFRLYLEPGRHTLSVRLEDHNFAVGNYLVDVGINQSVSSNAYDSIRDFPLFEIKPSAQFLEWEARPWGAVHLEKLTWSIEHAVVQSK